MKTQFYIITGMSGAGKSQALKILEDLGFFCIDNLPIALLPKFADLCLGFEGRWGKVAIGIDIRAGKESLASLEKILNQIKKKGINHEVVFFNANDATLLQRYSETRRRHPLGKLVSEGIRRERKLLAGALNLADKEIDTSQLTLGEFKEILAREFNIHVTKYINVSLVSFGYKYGLPTNSDIVIDVRFLPNPNYIMKLRYKTGRDKAVVKYVEGQKPTKEFLNKFFQLLEFLMPLYVTEGKSHLTISIGCTGGRHRSVFVTEATAQFLKSKKLHVSVYHRDIDRLKTRIK